MAPFVTNDSVQQKPGDFLARVPSAIHTREALFDVLVRELRFPSYFGRNWDALDECLGDLEWLSEHRVVLMHDAVPHLPRRELVIYLEILSGAAIELSERGVELVVAFPPETSELKDALSGMRRV